VVSRIIRWDTLGPFSQLIQEMTTIRGDSESFEFSHEGRRSNVDAHNVAMGFIFLSLGLQVWFLNPPDGVCTNIMI
jgi:hypothetical protein